jgi:hypothetical protein
MTFCVPPIFKNGGQIVTFGTLMVHVEPGQLNTGLLQVTADLAERLGAMVIGITSCQPNQIIEGDGYIPGEILEADRVETKREIVEAEKEFRGALQQRVNALEWSSMEMERFLTVLRMRPGARISS